MTRSRFSRRSLPSLVIAGLLTIVAVALLAAAPVRADTGQPTLASESVSNITSDGVTFTGTVDLNGASSATVELQWGNQNYEWCAFMSSQSCNPTASGPGNFVQSVSSANGNVQTVSFPWPEAFDQEFYARWPNSGTWIENQIVNHFDQWVRTAPTVTLHYQIDVDGNDGPDQTVTSPAPTEAASVSTGQAVVKGLQAFFTGTVNDHAQGYAFAAMEWGTSSGAYDHLYIPNPYGLTSETNGPSFAPSADVDHQLSFASDFPRTLAPGTTVYYRWVADNGFGSGPAYGQTLSFTLPGGVTPAQTRTDVSKALKTSAAQTNISKLLKHGGVAVTLTAPGVGKEKIVWHYTPAGHHSPVLIASGTKTFAKAGSAKLTLGLTKQGRVLLKKSKHLKVIAVGTFTPKSGTSVTAQRSITLG